MKTNCGGVDGSWYAEEALKARENKLSAGLTEAAGRTVEGWMEVGMQKKLSRRGRTSYLQD
eukprot:CAMPEP_0185042174 /NCGR_PEP_ID=MMETSP1103-20130426/42196_1 /TAXON_ID=36769 /ORGANISM="Paraphysomonas bandaiensis, Strain Caron Lab Isolate" /LENGTH=60 /DNA_ID=CAMNT_0027582197 /DNA_START=327 /DNA_END=509 /DNA_ORIENTATION=+